MLHEKQLEVTHALWEATGGLPNFLQEVQIMPSFFLLIILHPLPLGYPFWIVLQLLLVSFHTIMSTQGAVTRSSQVVIWTAGVSIDSDDNWSVGKSVFVISPVAYSWHLYYERTHHQDMWAMNFNELLLPRLMWMLLLACSEGKQQ